jgi:hypothetical protein
MKNRKRKRFQECNWLEKTWRYRWYLLIPLQWIYYTATSSFKVYKDKKEGKKIIHTDEYYVIKGVDLWKLLKGTAQGKMRWYYTWEEVKENLKINKKKNG